MKTFKSIAMVKYPPALVWATIRDQLPELVPLLDDIEQITVVERADTPDGATRLVNLWKANLSIPPVLTTVIDPDTLAWTDRAEWRPRSFECHWRIEPQFLPEGTQYSGVTRYDSALGGRGTRITFEGQLDVPAGALAVSSPFVESALARGAESVAATLIPKNFQKLAQAVSAFLADHA
jgi:hypothetical protein